MDWLNEPNVEVELDGFCIVRVCPNKHYCDGYFCGVLHCGTNS